MKRVFVVRPFGTKRGRDFDEVHRALIEPAIVAAGLDGGTTAEFIEAGNIRTDMFRELLVTDIVIADVSIDNANVYYELGIRHALRAQDTVLIRAPTDAGDRFPFDLQTERYFTYDAADPASSVDELTRVLQATASAGAVNSPVFNLLPELVENELHAFLPVPAEFGEDVRRAKAENRPGDLDLYAEEIGGLPWERTGLAAVGRAQLAIGHHRGARTTWERVREFSPEDIEANTILGTVYQKLGLLTDSDLALDRVLTNDRASRNQIAEALALQGRNAKTLWQDDWSAEPDTARRQIAALRSGHLDAAADRYRRAFDHDLNAYYPGVNAFALLLVRQKLADLHPAVWLEHFDEGEEARAREELDRAVAELEVLVRHAVGAADASEEQWAVSTKADLACLTSTRGPRVATAYRAALAIADPFDVASMRSQLLVYRALGLFAENVEAALEVLGEEQPPVGDAAHVVVFTGHRIDAPGRPSPRFPASREDDARRAIRERIEAQIDAAGAIDLALAGAANGGDILFLEVCVELGIPIEVYLAMPPADFISRSVADAGPEWVDRFHRLCADAPPFVLSADGQVPRWITGRDYSIWQRNNLWMLHNALARGGDRTMLLALWDGEAGDDVGGTEDLVARAAAVGAKVDRIDTKALFSL